MKNKTHTAFEMIAKGHPVEMVMEIVGLDPEEMLEILNGALGEEPELELRKVHVVECVLQVMESEMLGEFDINVN